MTLTSRIENLRYIFDELQSTSSLNEKTSIVDNISILLRDDFNACLEVLSNKIVFGYKYYKTSERDSDLEKLTVRQLFDFLQTPKNQKDLSYENIDIYVGMTNKYYYFLEPIVNKTLRLGIGKSVMAVSDTAPMLAKKYEGKLDYSFTGYYVTEKLDGNRCIAFYDGEKWNFVSRNGKQMYVNFDMAGLPTDFIYDGEVLSREQVEMSEDIAGHLLNKKYQSKFNNTSGLINTHTVDKDLVYNIFDIQCNLPYSQRRKLISKLEPKSSNVRILPILQIYDDCDHLADNIGDLLDYVTSIGGEGLMINIGDDVYRHKRTSSLLKYKDVQTIDMQVSSTFPGKGKYEGMCGGIFCVLNDIFTGETITCSVGTGLTDEQRLDWAIHPEHIVGKIVEIAYFSTSQEAKLIGSKTYSLRFPRLKKVREDKIQTSKY